MLSRQQKPRHQALHLIFTESPWESDVFLDGPFLYPVSPLFTDVFGEVRMALFSHRGLGWAVLASELGHVFCCILPTFFSLFSFAANIGLIGGAPGFLAVVHEIIHRYELPVILFSGFMVGVGWLVYWGSRRLRVCGDAMCAKGARHNRLILVIATGLFTVNVFIFAVVHKNVFGLPFFMEASPSHEEHEIP